VSLIEVYADIWCPFSHVGIRAVIRRRRELGRDDAVLRVLPWPLELANGAPLDPNATELHVEELRDQIAPELFAGFDPSSFPSTTLPALAVAEVAYRKDLVTGEAVSLALRDALFEEGRDISNPAVLGELMCAHGLEGPNDCDRDAVYAEWDRGKNRGVKGSPHFFCGEMDVFCPSLRITKGENGDLELKSNIAALDVFLSGCLG
jgi:predicted DsbA family dithiol-disulfide isomerase